MSLVSSGMLRTWHHRLRLGLLIVCSLRAHVETRMTCSLNAPGRIAVRLLLVKETAGALSENVSRTFVPSRCGAAPPTRYATCCSRQVSAWMPIVCMRAQCAALRTGSPLAAAHCCCGSVRLDGPSAARSWRRRRHPCCIAASTPHDTDPPASRHQSPIHGQIVPTRKDRQEQEHRTE